MNAIITLLMPLCLISSGFINMILFYFGLHAFDDIRRLASIVILCVFWGISLLKLLFLYLDYTSERKKILLLCCIPALWIVVFIGAILQFGIQDKIIITLRNFGIYCIPAFIFAISIAIERTEQAFIKGFKWYAVIIAPLMIFYVVRIIITPEFVYEYSNLGALCYLNIGYVLAPIILFYILGLFLYRNNNLLDIGIIILLWIALIFTGAKGPLLYLLMFILLFVLYLLVKKRKEKSVFGLLTAMVCILLFFFFVYSPPSAGVHRITNFNQNLKHKIVQFVATMDEEREQISTVIKEDSPATSIKENMAKAQEVPTSATSNNILTNEPEIIKEQPPALLYHNGWERMYLWKLAIAEGNNNPFTGLGPMGYTLKYEFYPHNIILELIADFGYLITTLFIIIVLVLISFLYRKSKNDRIIACMFLYIISCIPGVMLSGTVYNSTALLFALGYACALPTNNKTMLIKKSAWKVK